ncbi:helix-turn-helix domain-containing protein [Desertimonas flava]|uniref:helix-turn-helix domain-containing protein n=1 Tax=Desertimonas flava TaxID=2064846 RepID=UPI000E34915B|nr:helix-turn-helix domain-containing protein [Desertimonas flava]
MPRPSATIGRGVLRSPDGTGRPQSQTVRPGVDVARFVERYWTVEWEVRGPARRFVLGHPVIHVTVEVGDGPIHGFATPVALVHGIVRRTFNVDLPPRGWVIGARFLPGGFRAVFGADAVAFTDRVVPLGELVGRSSAAELLTTVTAAEPEDRAAAFESWLHGRVPGAVDPEFERVRTIVAAMAGDRTLTRAEDVAAAHGMSMRTLQRLLRRHVGVGPKWLLARFRLHDAVAAIDQADGAGERIDLADLAASLGWFDQAHFTRDFTAHVGVSPLVYLARPR